MIYLLFALAVEITFCLIEYTNAKAVFVNPSFLAMTVVTASTILGSIGNIYWDVQISPIILPVIFWGFFSIMISDCLARRTTKRYHYSVSNNSTEIKLSNIKVNIVITVVILCTLTYCLDIVRAGASMGYGGLSAIYAVKRNRSGTNILIRQGVKIVMAAMFIHTFVFVNNFMVLKKREWREFKHLIPAVCAVICCVFTSVRTEIFRVLTVLMVCMCVLIFQKKNWKTTSLRIFLRKIIPYGVLGIILLVGVRFIVKGTENATSNTYGVFMYAAYYLGTPIIVLGSKLSQGLSIFRGTHFGEMTFNQFYGFLVNFGLFKDEFFQEGSTNVWIDEANKITANVDTIFGPPMIDFGIIGMSVYLFTAFYFLNKYYYKYIYKTQASKKRNVKLITFSFLASIPSMAFYTNYVNQYLTVYFILTYIIIKILEQYYGMTPSIIRVLHSRKRIAKNNCFEKES